MAFQTSCPSQYSREDEEEYESEDFRFDDHERIPTPSLAAQLSKPLHQQHGLVSTKDRAHKWESKGHIDYCTDEEPKLDSTTYYKPWTSVAIRLYRYVIQTMDPLLLRILLYTCASFLTFLLLRWFIDSRVSYHAAQLSDTNTELAELAVQKVVDARVHVMNRRVESVWRNMIEIEMDRRMNGMKRADNSSQLRTWRSWVDRVLRVVM